MRSKSSSRSQMPPPEPPIVKLGRMIAGSFVRSRISRASATVVAMPEARHLEPDLLHRRAEELSVLGLVDRLEVRADQLRRRTSSSTPASARAIARFSAVWPPIVGSSASGFSRAMICSTELDRHRLDVGPVGHLRIRHDRGRIRVDEDDAIALFAQRLAGLGPRVVELAGLADHDRAGADHENRVDVGSFRHGLLRDRSAGLDFGARPQIAAPETFSPATQRSTISRKRPKK